ncbi:hypothetical protein [Novosphingobium olei]|uniref:hypothetical protein n=1 Tax=Novosphingobium olei TaxID=2728851 RepID=UPI00308C23D5|nr:hypothetical protein NSDW_35380 [Novosphingobium olei]
MKHTCSILIFAVIFAFQPLFAKAAGARAKQQEAVNAQHAEKEDVGTSDRVICRSIEQIGTRLGNKRVCATAAQWAAMRAEERAGLERIQTQNYKNN